MNTGSMRGWRAAVTRLALLALALSGAVGLGSVIAAPAATAAVASPLISAPPDVVVGEASGHVDLVVRLSAAGTSAVSVDYATANSTAGGGTVCNALFVPVSGTLSFAPGETSKTVPVNLNNCSLAGFASFTFNLSNSLNSTISRASARVGIVGDGNLVATPGLYVRDAVVDTTAGTVSVPVLLGGPAGSRSASTVTVGYATHDGTAVAGSDYTTSTGTLTFAPGQTAANIPVPITARAGAVPSRRFSVTLASPANATIVDSTGVVVIGASGAAKVAAPVIAAPPDVVVGEADGYLDLAVTLSAPGVSPVSVDYATGNSTAGNGTVCNALFVGASGTLNFAPGETTKTVRIDLKDCGVVGFHSFTFDLSNSLNSSISRASTRVGIVGDGNLTATPALSVRDATVGTTAGTIYVPVLLGGPAGARSASTVTVAYATHDGTAVAGSDYTTSSGTLTFGPGQTVQNIPVPITARAGAAPERRFTVTLSGPTNASVVDSTGVVIIGATGGTAAGAPLISAPADVLVGQADGYLDVAVTLSAPGVSPVSVDYATASSTAGGGTVCNALFVGVAGTLNFAPGETTKTVRVDLNNCLVAGLRSFTFNLSNSVNSTITRPSTRIGIVGDANPPSTNPGLYVRDSVVDTRAGTISVPVLLGGPAGTPSASTVSVAYATHDGTAVAGTDYTTSAGTLTFAPGQTLANIPVPITARTGAAPSRRFSLTLTSPTNATVVDSTGVVVIGATGGTALSSPLVSTPPDVVVGEVDGYLDVPVSLNAPSANPVSVDYSTFNSTAGNGTVCNALFVGASGTLNFLPGETTKTVRVDLNNCLVAGFRSFTFDLSNSVNSTIARPSTRIGIVGDANPPSTNPGLSVRDVVVDTTAGTTSVPVLLGGPAGSPSASTVTVAYATHDGTALAGSDYTTSSGTLTFGPGQTVQNIPVPITARAGAAPTRGFTVTLSGPTNASVVDPTGVITIGASGAPKVAAPAISAPPDVVVAETGGYLDVAVTLSAPGVSPVSVSYATANSTAGGGTVCNATYVPVSGTLSFAPGETTKTVRIDLNNCGVATPGSFTFNLSDSGNATIARASTLITIVSTPAAPAAPTSVSAVAGDQSAVVSFAAAASGGDPANSYTVTASPGGATASGLASPITVTGLTNGTAYTFRVTATNSLGTSPASAASNSVTPHAPATVPSAPTGVTATAGNFQASVSWVAPASNGGAAITGYTVTSSPGGRTATVGGSTTTATVAGLTHGTAYTFTVTATNSAGTGPASAPSNAVIPAFPNGGAGFTALSPQRVLDTRNGTGAPAAKVGAGSTITLTVPGLPVGTTAVTLNVTATGGTAGTFITVYPGGETRPNTSNLNVAAGLTVPNLVTVAVGAGNEVSFYNSAGSINLLADLAGYYTPTSGSGFTALSPQRVLDTRNGTGAPAAKVGAGKTITLTVPGLPVGTTAVTLNVTATGGTAGTFITVYPAGVARPNTSNLNVAAGQTVPNLVTVAVGAGSKVSFFNSAGSINLLADLAGYYTPTSGSGFTALSPQRVLDTRNGTGAPAAKVGAGSTITLIVPGLPVGTTAVTLNVTATGGTAGTFITVYPGGETRPNTSNLNVAAGQTIPNLVTVAVGAGNTVSFYNSAGSINLLADLAGYYTG